MALVATWPSITPIVLVAAACAVAVLVLGCLALPRYQRATSTRPAVSLLFAGPAASTLAWFCGASDRTAVTLAAASVTIAAGSALYAAYARHQVGPAAAVLIGSTADITCLLDNLPQSVDPRAICLTDGAADDATGGRTIRGIPVLGDVSATRAARSVGADQVLVLPGRDITPAALRQLSWQLEHADVELAVMSPLSGVAPGRIAPHRAGDLLVLSVQPSRRSQLVSLAKDAIDRTGGALILAIVAVPLLVAAIAIRLDSTGPALFRQRRVGVDGNEFTMFKLRSMTTDAEDRLADLRALNEGAGPLFKLSNDPRVTRIGSFIRKTSLDELPQLFNVVRGEMSLIGPRPALPTEVAQYTPEERRRLQVKPGMTGLWQVSGRSALSWDQSIALDNFYVDNWTLTTDVAIAVRTIKAVTTADGAV
ncbi:sugar transferase [Kribbella sp. NBC_01245]|uniref:sugar transferase n=1 Tax=Kribbella sp. NBC_01245 TaxID=2903578 RepID=UPI002E2DB317|nr:sugar transferase [Kribbella sp. NBC_01245]